MANATQTLISIINALMLLITRLTALKALAATNDLIAFKAEAAEVLHAYNRFERSFQFQGEVLPMTTYRAVATRLGSIRATIELLGSDDPDALECQRQCARVLNRLVALSNNLRKPEYKEDCSKSA